MATPMSGALPRSSVDDPDYDSSGHPVGELQHVSTIVGLDPCQLCGEHGPIVHTCSKRFDRSYTGVNTPAASRPSFPNQNISASSSMTHSISYNGSDPMDRKRKKSENDLTGMVSLKREKCHEVPVSTFHSQGYDVFLSFKGDTRKGFTDHLYQRMVDAGISVFKDNVNLPSGEDIRMNLSKGIEMSKIAIPILSKNYGDSKWCLDELVCMLECKNSKKQKVLPIFYDVTPSQVRHQTGNYLTAKADDEETMKKWREALREIPSLKGWELAQETGGYEGQLTKMIVRKVLVELKKNHLLVTNELVGIDDQIEKVKNLLAIDSNDVRKMVWLWGMGGIGKTTLAKFIYNELLDKYESCSFHPNIREKSLEYNGLERLQSQLASNLSRQEHQGFSSIDEGVKNLENMFRMKKVLILLDDVDNINQLKALAGEVNWFGLGSRVIVTTRNKRIMKDFLALSNDKDIAQECSCYEVQPLNEKKSLQLFCRHAFRQNHPADQFTVLSRAIVKTTGGLPLSLEVTGSSLVGERESVWEEILKKLRKMPKEEVQERLKIGYDKLNDDKKQMFLDVACLLIGEDVDVMEHIWKDRGFSAETEIEALILLSLLKTDNNKFSMHDNLRDLGREIVRKENDKNPNKRSRVWDANEGRAAITYVSSASEVEALHLRKDLNHGNWIKRKHLRRYMDIWFLKLDDVNLTGNFQDLLPKLRWLRWQCSSKDFPITNLNLKKLLFLDLSLSCVTSDGKLWKSFQSSKKLKFLNLKSCFQLITLDVSTFIHLKRLVLYNCDRLKQVSMGNLKKLIFLSIKYCDELQDIEGLDQLEALEELILCACKVEKLPILFKFSSLKTLKLLYCSKLQDIEGFDQLETLEELNLYRCDAIDKSVISKLKSRKTLKFNESLQLQEFREEMMNRLSLSRIIQKVFDMMSNEESIRFGECITRFLKRKEI